MRYPTVELILGSWQFLDQADSEAAIKEKIAKLWKTTPHNITLDPLYDEGSSVYRDQKLVPGFRVIRHSGKFRLETENSKQAQAGAWKWCGKCVRMTEHDSDGACKDCGN